MELEANQAIGARLIVRGMAEYPTLLEQCKDAPEVVCCAVMAICWRSRRSPWSAPATPRRTRAG